MVKHLILINGLGSRTLPYRLAATLWKVWGFEVHFFHFNWEDKMESFESKMQRLTVLSKKFSATGAIGISAGGTAAVNLLARSPSLTKIVTVGSPYYLVGPVESHLLTESDKVLQSNLAHFSESAKHKIMSFHGVRDTTVGVRQSRIEGIAHAQLKSKSHLTTIIYALTLGSAPLRRFLSS
jgi:hypothetical protein